MFSPFSNNIKSQGFQFSSLWSPRRFVWPLGFFFFFFGGGEKTTEFFLPNHFGVWFPFCVTRKSGMNQPRAKENPPHVPPLLSQQGHMAVKDLTFVANVQFFMSEYARLFSWRDDSLLLQSSPFATLRMRCVHSFSFICPLYVPPEKKRAGEQHSSALRFT